MYIWSYALTIFAIIGMIGAVVFGTLNFYGLNSANTITKFEVGSLPQIFEF